MNVFNRTIMVLLILFLIVAVGTVLITPLNFVDVTRANLSYVEDLASDAQVLLVFRGGGGGVLVILLVLLWLELRRPRRKTVRVKTQGGGNAHLDVQSVVQSLEYRIDELPGVRQVRPRILSHGRDIEVVLDLDTSPSVNIPTLTDQIVGLTNDIVEGQLGLKIRSRVRVNIRHEPYPRGTMPSTATVSKEAAIPPATEKASAAKPAEFAPAKPADASPAAVSPQEAPKPEGETAKQSSG